MVAASGRQTVLVSADGRQELVVVEVGGGPRRYRVDGIDVLDGYGEDERADGARGQPLLPWPNRIDGGRYEFGGAHDQAPLNEPELDNAIHGLTRWCPWTVSEEGSDHATLAFTLHPQPGYRWTLDLQIAYRLGPDGLTVTVRATNRSDSPAPFGAGFHPYFRVTERVDAAVLTVPAARFAVANERGIPTGMADVADTPYDFRRPRNIGDLLLNHAYTVLERTADEAHCVLADPTSGREVSVALGPGYDWVMVYTGDTLAPERTRQGLALEPMTAAPNAFRTGDGLLVLEPGRSWEGHFGVRPSWVG